VGQGVVQRGGEGRLAEAASSARISGPPTPLGGGEIFFAWICHNRRMSKDYVRGCVRAVKRSCTLL
jgi:hypothetical protein